MTRRNWQITVYTWIVGGVLWSGTCYGMLLAG